MFHVRGLQTKKGVRIFVASENKTHILCKLSGVCLYISAKFKISVVFVLSWLW